MRLAFKKWKINFQKLVARVVEFRGVPYFRSIFFLFHIFRKRVLPRSVFLLFLFYFSFFFFFRVWCSIRFSKIIKNNTFFSFFFSKKMKFRDDFQFNILRKIKKSTIFMFLEAFWVFISRFPIAKIVDWNPNFFYWDIWNDHCFRKVIFWVLLLVAKLEFTSVLWIFL